MAHYETQRDMVLGAFEIHHGAGVFIIGVLVSIAASAFLNVTD